MTKELEERLAALEEELALTKKRAAKRPKKSKKWYLAAAILILIVAIGGVSYYLTHLNYQSSSPIPSAIIETAGFQLYYPNQLPAGYTYTAESASNESGVVLYKLHNGDKELLLIEQPSPKADLMLGSTVGLDPIDTPNGKAYVGKNKATPVAILQTKDTLINISGSPDISADIINSLVRDLQTVSQ